MALRSQPTHVIKYAEMDATRSIFYAKTIGGHDVSGVVDTLKGFGSPWTARSGDERVGAASRNTKDAAVAAVCDRADEVLAS